MKPHKKMSDSTRKILIAGLGVIAVPTLLVSVASSQGDELSAPTLVASTLTTLGLRSVSPLEIRVKDLGSAETKSDASEADRKDEKIGGLASSKHESSVGGRPTPPSKSAVKEAAEYAASKNFPRGREEKALDKFAKLLRGAIAQAQSPKELLKDLESAGLDPVAAKDFNAATGKMLVVRTGESLPGTRYFHAQYFEGEDGQPFLQHMSFEFKPGPESFDRAVVAVRSNFPGLGQPSTEEAGLISWKTDDGYIVWIRKLEKEDLTADPYNAYTKEDVGTIRVAIELDIHEEEE